MLKVWTRFLVVNHPHRQLLSVLLVVNHPHRQLLSVWLVVNHPHRQLLSVWLVVNQPHRQLLSVWLVVNQPHRQLLSVLAKTSTGGRPSTANHCGAVNHTGTALTSCRPLYRKGGEDGGGVDESSLKEQSHFISVCLERL